MKKSLIVSFRKPQLARASFKADNKTGHFGFKVSSESLYDNTLPIQQSKFKAGRVTSSNSDKELVNIEEDLTGMNEWDIAHLYYDEDKRQNLNEIGFVEPDLLDKYLTNADMSPSDMYKSTSNNNRCIPEDYYPYWAKPESPSNWHLDDNHAQLLSAWNAVKNIPGNETVVAHMDTGYDPDHIARPKTIITEQNFVEGEPAGSAKDPMDSRFLQMPGHGNATLALLAGNFCKVNYNGGSFDFQGGYPTAQMVPIRISPTVILLKTSAVARALDWVLRSNLGIEVISMSMGGLPKKEWADKVNELYENGIFYACASGDCYGGLPTHRTIYPARFNRVVSVCGAQFNNEEYYKDFHFTTMMGSYGPNSVMEHAIGAFTPNVPWAKAFCTPDANNKNTGFSLQGGGTSAATPQVAAAAAMYLKKYRAQLQNFSGWEKVEAVRYALFRSALDLADDPDRSFKYFGQGILKANDALSIIPDKKNLIKAVEDSVSFPLFRVFFKASPGEDPAKREMFELELLQLVQKSKELNAIMAENISFIDLDEKGKKQFVDAVIADQQASLALKNYLKDLFSK